MQKMTNKTQTFNMIANLYCFLSEPKTLLVVPHWQTIIDGAKTNKEKQMFVNAKSTSKDLEFEFYSMHHAEKKKVTKHHAETKKGTKQSRDKIAGFSCLIIFFSTLSNFFFLFDLYK
ncbi:hypothetical protein V8G54_006263 [Vigna mungo]|uniref:Uncharacterized protein n=1 Tax=Vigna mungo TaxID=3915 RepID=A0AAQ3NYN8_VIGMU